jgi:hypothetical protein
MIVVPGLNSLPGILNLTATSMERILAACPNIRKIGNLLSWNLRRWVRKYVIFCLFHVKISW